MLDTEDTEMPFKSYTEMKKRTCSRDIWPNVRVMNDCPQQVFELGFKRVKKAKDPPKMEHFRQFV